MAVILIVDDKELWDRLVSLPGSTVLTAFDSQTGTKLALQSNPDVIILGEFGFLANRLDFCRQLKQDERLQDIPVIFLITLADDIETRKKALDAGADVFLASHFEATELTAMVKAMVKIKLANQIQGKTKNLTNTNHGGQKQAELKWHESEIIFQSLVEHLPQRIFIKDLNSVYISCNENFARDLGITPEQIVGKDDFAFFPKELANAYRSDDKAVIKSNKLKKIEEPFITGDRKNWVQVIKVPYHNQEGKVIGVLGIFEDITERKQAEEKLQQSENRYRTIFENVQDVYYEVSLDGTILEISPSIEFLSQGQYRADKLIGKSIYEFYANMEERNKFIAAIEENGRVTDFEIQLLNPDGSLIFCSISSKLSLNVQGKPEKITGTLRDISQRKQMEAELRVSNEMFSKIFSLTPVAISLNDLSDQNRFIDCNEAFFQLTGFRKEEVIGRNPNDLNLYQFPQERTEALRKFSTEGRLHDFEHHYLKKNGDSGTGLLSMEIFELGGKDYVIAANFDITDRKLAEKQLSESEEHYHRLFDNMINGIMVVEVVFDQTGNPVDHYFVQANAAFEKMTGVISKEQEGKTSKEMSIKWPPEVLEKLYQVAITGEPIQYERYNESLQRYYDTRVFSPRKGQFAHVFTDITSRKQAEIKLEKTNRLYSFISQINQTIVRLKNRDELFEEVCRIAVDFGKFRMAWVGLIDKKTQTVRPKAFSGYEKGYLSIIKPISVSDTIEGHGPTGTAIREGSHFVCHDFETDPIVAPWKNEALERNYHSSISMPIKESGETIGAFTLYSEVPEFFDQQEIELLTEVTSDISFALNTFILEKKHQETLNALIESEQRYRMIFDHSLDAFLLTNPDGSILSANPSTCQMFGRSEEEICQNGRNFIIDASDPRLAQAINERAQTGRFYGELTGLRSDGTKFPIEATSTLFYDINGNQRTSIIIRDITTRKQAEEEIRQARERFQTLFEQAPLGMALVNSLTGQFYHLNTKFAEITGYKLRDLLSTDWKTITHPDDLQNDLNFMSRFMADEIPGYHLEKRYLRPDKSSVWISLTVTRIQYEDSRYPYHLSMIEDITERKESENLLQESRALLRSIVDSTTDMIWSVDADQFGLVDWNPSFERYFKEKRGIQLQNGMRPQELFPAESPFIQQWINFFNEAKSKGSLSVEYLAFAPNQIFLLSINLLQHQDQNFGISVFAKDITEIRAAEAEINRSRKRFQTMFEQAPLGMALIDSLSGKIYEVNDKFTEIAGRTKQELCAIDWISITHPDDVQEDMENMARMNAGKIDGFMMQKRYIRPDGSYVWINMTIARIQTEDPKSPRHLCMIEDITQSRANSEKVAILSRAVEQSPASIVITDILGNIEYVNPKFTQVTGYSREEAIGKNPRILKSETKSPEEYKQMWETITSGHEWRGEFLNVRKNGETYYESAFISPIIDNKGKIIQFLAVKEDITEQRKITAQIKTLSAVVEQSPLLILITDANHKVEYANTKFTSFTQYTTEEIKGKIPWIFNPKHFTTETFSLMWEVLNKGEVWQADSTNRKKDGSTFWEHVTVFPLHDNNDAVSNYIIIKDDITEKKHLLDDLVAAKEKAEESDRLKTAFLANMSHEIRTPLNSIIGFSDLLLDPFFEPEQQTEFVQMIKSSGNNLLSIISDILDISKIESGQVRLFQEKFSINQMIQDIGKEFAYQAEEKGLKFMLNLPVPEKVVYLQNDPTRTRQILTNFVNNALKFTEKGFIEIGFKVQDKKVLVHIKDTGIGIPKEYHEKVFERFRQVETAHTRKYGGNGLGLTISKQLADLLGCEIWMESEPGQGSTFYLAIPM